MIQLHVLGPILDQIYTRDSLEFTRNGYTGSVFFVPVIFVAPPVWRAFSQLSWAPMIQLHAVGPILNQILP